MKTLLRHIPTGLYVKAANQWTATPEQALDFKTMSQAIRFVEEAGLRRMELAFVSPRLCRYTEVPLEMLGWSASVTRRCQQAA